MADETLATAFLLKDVLQGALDDLYFTSRIDHVENLALSTKLAGLNQFIQLYIDNHKSDGAPSYRGPVVGLGTVAAVPAVIPAGEGGVTLAGAGRVVIGIIGWEVAIGVVVGGFLARNQKRQT